GVLTPTFGTGTVYGASVTIPYYFALAPDYDFTFAPMITSKQGPLLQGEWRQRLLTGSYTIRATRLFQADKDVFIQDGVKTPGYLDWRGSVQSRGQFNLSDKWFWGWDGTLLSDKTYLQDYGLLSSTSITNLMGFVTPDYALSQIYLGGRGDRSYFEARAMYFYGFSGADDQTQLPVVHPVIDQLYVFKSPIFGGELSFQNNVISLSRQNANFDPITQNALNTGLCTLT